MKSMCGLAGITKMYINHSIRTTGALSLFRKNVPENVIQEVTGCQSLNGLHQYEKLVVMRNKLRQTYWLT